MPRPLSVFAPNLPHRGDRRHSLEAQFEAKAEFRLTVVPAIVHPRHPPWGLWQTFVGIVRQEMALGSHCFVFCEDDHVFTTAYSEARLREAIREADALQADILSGGMSWLRDAVQVSPQLFHTDRFNGMQFTVVFRRFYQTIIERSPEEGYVTDIHLSDLSDRIYVMHPYISVQQEFGYSDVTPRNNESGYVGHLFEKAQTQLCFLEKVKQRYEALERSAVRRIDEGTVVFYTPSDTADHAQQWDDLRRFVANVDETVEAIAIKARNVAEDALPQRTAIRSAVEQAAALRTQVLYGHADSFGNAVPLGNGLCWVDWVRIRSSR